MNDLLRAVKGSIRGSGGEEGLPYSPGGRPPADVEAGRGGGSATDIAAFLGMVDRIKASLTEFDTMCQDLEKMEERSKTLVKSREVQECRCEMKALLDKMAALLFKVKAEIEHLEQDNEAAMHAPNRVAGSASERTRMQQTSGLAISLNKRHSEFKGIKERIERDYLQVVKRRIEVVTGKDVSEEEAESIIKGGQAEAIIQKAIQNDARNRISLQNTLAEVQERNEAIHEIAQGTEEIVTLLKDLALIVHDQGQKLNNIQKVIDRAVSFVDVGVEHVQEAYVHQKAVNKKRFMFWSVIILAIIIAIAVIVAVVMKRRK